MYWNFNKMVSLFSDHSIRHLLLNGKWGLEKESLRVTPEGELSLKPHPEAFGDKTLHSHVTTDFSESQMELITPAFSSIDQTYAFLNSLHKEVNKAIDDEVLWPHSMPGPLPSDDLIPLARYSDTNDGKIKEIYRSGLALRYGKKVQMISGIHYNFSFQQAFWTELIASLAISMDRQAFINEAYMGLVRNVLRYRWLLVYLFGASPVSDESYHDYILERSLTNHAKAISPEMFSRMTKKATSLRMSRFGYENFHSRLSVSYNSLEDYINDIRRILGTKNDRFAKLGVFHEGRQIQLNDYQLQIENEFYSPVRVKQMPLKGETQLDALRNRGIEYLEIRTFDLNPYENNGTNLEQLYFTQVFMLYCLFEQSAHFSGTEVNRINANAHKTAVMGRSDNLKLTKYNGRSVSLKKWGLGLIDKMRPIARLLDHSMDNNTYTGSIEAQYKKVLNNAGLPSSQMIDEMNRNQESYLDFNLRKARENRSRSLA